MVRHYGPDDIDRRSTNSDRSEPRPSLLSSQGSPVNPLTGAGFDKVRSPNSICRVPLLPSLQIGGRLMSRVAASAPIQ